MSRILYFSDERVAADYRALVGDFATVNDDAEAQWLVDNGWAFDSTFDGVLPAAYHRGNAGPWLGYRPDPPPSPPPPPPAEGDAPTRRYTRKAST